MGSSLNESLESAMTFVKSLLEGFIGDANEGEGFEENVQVVKDPVPSLGSGLIETENVSGVDSTYTSDSEIIGDDLSGLNYDVSTHHAVDLRCSQLQDADDEDDVFFDAEEEVFEPAIAEQGTELENSETESNISDTETLCDSSKTNDDSDEYWDDEGDDVDTANVMPQSKKHLDFPPVPSWFLSKSSESNNGVMPGLTKRDIMGTMRWYVRSSVEDFMLEIVSIENLSSIDELVERIFDLPLEDNLDTYDILREVIFSIASLNDPCMASSQIVQFWKAVHAQCRVKTDNSAIAIRLKTDFLAQAHKILMGASEFNAQEQLYQQLLKQCKPTDKIYQEKLKDTLQIIQEENFDRAMAVGQLLIELYPSGVVTSLKMLQMLVNFSNRSDLTAAHLLIMFIEEIGHLMENFLFGSQHTQFSNVEPLTENQKGVAQIYGKLHQISKTPTDGFAPGNVDYLRQQAKMLVLQKISGIREYKEALEKTSATTALAAITEESKASDLTSYKDKDSHSSRNKKTPRKNLPDAGRQLDETYEFNKGLIDIFLNVLSDESTHL